jgi:hypothetical protein
MVPTTRAATRAWLQGIEQSGNAPLQVTKAFVVLTIIPAISSIWSVSSVGT